MRFSAHFLCLAASLMAAPAFAQVGKDGASAPATQSLSGQAAPNDPLAPFNLGFNKSTERPVLPLAPIEKDQLEFSWKPGGKWGITLDLTSREPNEVLPREEVGAVLSYQVTPRFRFGGGVTLKGDSLASTLTAPQNFRDQVSDTTVRVESAFSF
ncbi:MAG TPA: hypothetical protein VG942_09045 [Hyphomonadaceae bacterium]|nr:hypothetical protein [Hyphomonadaceae bacterium]